MTPPEIRYPLPTLILVILLALLARRGEEWTRPARTEIRRRIDRALHGPPVPETTAPQTRGRIPRLGLVLRDGAPVFARPNGDPLPPIDKRGFVSIHAGWSSKGEDAPPEFHRIGSRTPIGWIAAADLLPWDTRLVHRAPDGAVRPIVGWSEGAVEVASWAKDAPWRTPAGRERIAVAEAPEGSIGVLVALVELPDLLDAAVADDDGTKAREARLRAVMGAWSGAEAPPPETIDELPPVVAARRLAAVSAAEAIARLNADRAAPDVAWSGRSFRFVPLEALP